MKKFLITVLGLVIIGGVALTLWLYPVITVKKVDVAGQVQTTSEELDAITQPLVGQNVLRVDTNDVAEQLVGLPWIASATAVKKLPSTIEVKLQEHEAILYAPRDDGDHLINSNGVAFVIENHPEGAIAVTGASEDDANFLRSVIGVLEAIGPDMKAHIAEIRIKDSIAVELVLHDGRVIFWGAPENNGDKAVAFAAALSRPEGQLDISGAPVIAVR
ncbi:MAG: FtsQ-type POTRA domain-containing protein [Corynebacterium sp.]|uniref:cell division protein FtsQ/DivIB n=1 Tax=Corynebacterium sp. TaxID=1720 RepID=UPI0026DD73A3|nr:FtsQ-type POTRA domain-containing protein [Corynebacterium sp.]MDO5097926.1 FtsQ-type POTRA domain-containing protein [Corynebacterium sp.]